MLALFNLTDWILMPLVLGCLGMAVYSGVAAKWIALIACLGAMGGFLAAWLIQFLPRVRRWRRYWMMIRGLDFYVMPGVSAPAVGDVYAELDLATKALAYLLPDVASPALLLAGVSVYFVPDIDERAYPDLGYYHLTGLDFGIQKLVELRPGALLKETALAHELCHTHKVHEKYPNTFESEIERALAYARAL